MSVPVRWYHPSPSTAIHPFPWLSKEVRQYLDNLIQPDWRVAEHGGGGSTIWLSGKCAHVTTVEQNLKWFTALAEKNLPRVQLVYGRYIPHFDGPLDLILIDGEPLEDRTQWIESAPYIVKPGGWVVLDNANYSIFNEAKRALLTVADLVVRFDGNEGVTQHLVTEFYQLAKLISSEHVRELQIMLARVDAMEGGG